MKQSKTFILLTHKLVFTGVATTAIAGMSNISPVFAQQAQPTPSALNQPAAPPPPLPNMGNGQISGTVSQYLMNPDGLVDGLLLSDNTVVRFPPHLSQELVQTVRPQDSVRVDGFFEFQGVIHASTITNANTQQSVVDTPPSAQNPPPAPNAYARQSMVSSGIIKALTYAPRGEIDGAVLDNGTIVHVPPPVGIQYASLFRIGAPLAASGYGTANGYGRSFEATLIGPSAGQMRPVAAAGYGPRDGSLGLVNMSERARFIHGRLSVELHAGKGTRVEVRAPIAAADDLY
jgi:hypothetical protein